MRPPLLFAASLAACLHPQPQSAPSTRRCPEGMVFVPGGRMIRTLDFKSTHGRRVAVELSPFCIDRTEVTIGAYLSCMKSGNCIRMGMPTHESGILSEDGCDGGTECDRWHADQAPDHPMSGVSWDAALAFCAWSGKRLPTDAEWDFAARGSDGRLTPWGGPDEQHCHFANNCRCTNGHAAVGAFPHDISPFGAVDMEGNVAEWVSDWYSDSNAAAFSGRDPHGPTTGEVRIVRGRAFMTLCDTFPPLLRTAVYPKQGYVAIGFRCAANIEKK